MQFCPLKRGKKREIEVGKNDVAAVTVMEDLDYKSRRGTSFGNYIPAFPSIRQTSMRKPLYRTNCAAKVGGGEPSGMGCLFLKLFFWDSSSLFAEFAKAKNQICPFGDISRGVVFAEKVFDVSFHCVALFKSHYSRRITLLFVEFSCIFW